MGIVTWVLVGLVLGVIKSVIAGKNNTVAYIVIGVVGAGLAGWIATLFGQGSIAAFHVWNLLISAAGAVVVLLIFTLTQRNREA